MIHRQYTYEMWNAVVNFTNMPFLESSSRCICFCNINAAEADISTARLQGRHVNMAEADIYISQLQGRHVI